LENPKNRKKVEVKWLKLTGEGAIYLSASDVRFFSVFHVPKLIQVC